MAMMRSPTGGPSEIPSFHLAHDLPLTGAEEGREDRLAGQRALPNAKEELLELSEILRSKLGSPIALDIAE